MQYPKRESPFKLLMPAAAGLALALAGGAVAGPGPNSATIPSTGQDISIQLTSPADGSEVTVPPGTVNIVGQASVGSLAGTPTNLLYAVDVSSSTQSPRDLDCNGDGALDGLDDINQRGWTGDVLDCEIQGVLSLNESLFGTVNVSAGLIAFARTAKTADVDPSQAGVQTFTFPLEADLNANALPDLGEVARSLRNGVDSFLATSIGVELFAPGAVNNGTDFSAPLQQIRIAFQPLSGERNIAYLLSDGQQTVSGNVPLVISEATALAAQGVAVNTYSVGPGGSGCAPSASNLLWRIADITGGTCTDVQDPSDLSATLSGSLPAGLDRVEVDDQPVTVNAVGDFSYEYACPGDHEQVTVTAVAYADDADPMTGVQTSVSADLILTCRPENSSPVADAGPDQTLECTGPDGAEVTLDGSGSSDPDDDPLAYLWASSVFGTASGVSFTTAFPLGSSAVSLTVTDDDSASDSDDLRVTVIDTTAPGVTVSASPSSLWPPNHKLVAVTVEAAAADACDPSARCRIIGVSSNEPLNGSGDGNTDVDWIIDGDLGLRLRAERAGTGSGREYYVELACEDAAGNVGSAVVTVAVSHDQGKGKDD